MAFCTLQAVLEAELDAVTRRRQRVGLAVERTSAGGQTGACAPATDVKRPHCRAPEPARGVLGGVAHAWVPSRVRHGMRAPRWFQSVSPYAGGCAARRQVRDVEDTVGVCISAGGLRSAAFGVGALRALATAGAMPPLSRRGFDFVLPVLQL